MNLSLQESGDGFESATPVVPVTIGDSVDDGVSLPGNVSIALDADTDVPARMNADRVWYANVAPDTDLIVKPVLPGVQQDLLLRSPASPEQFEFTVALPAGGHLQWAEPREPMAPGMPRAVQVTAADGNALAYVYPPMGYDADGKPLQTAQDFEGNTLRLTVGHRADDVRYPAYVDPTVSTPAYFRAYDLDGWAGWNITPDGYYEHRKNDPAIAPGLSIRSIPNTFYVNGHYGEFSFAAPANMRIAQAQFYNWSHAPWASAINLAIANPYKNGWAQPVGFIAPSAGNSTGGNPGISFSASSGNVSNACYLKPNTTIEQHDCAANGPNDLDMAIFRLAFSNPFGNNPVNSGNSIAQIAMSNAQIDMADLYPPRITSTDAPAHNSVGAWTNDGGPAGGVKTYRVKLTAHDDGSGLGGRDLTGDATNITDNGHYDYIVKQRCTGDPIRSHCQNDDAAGYFDYGLAEGRDTLNLSVYDVTRNRSDTRTWTARIDRSPPILTPSGDLYATGVDESGRDLFSLRVDATDGVRGGTPAQQRSGVQRIRMTIGDLLYEKTADPACSGDSCPLTVEQGEWELDTDDLTEGSHTVRLEAWDKVGNPPAVKTWTINVPGPTLYGQRLAAWRTSVSAAVDAANPLPLTAAMPVPPNHWRTPESCEASEGALKSCFDQNQTWGEAVDRWLDENPMLTRDVSSLPLPPTFDYGRSRTARRLTLGMSKAFDFARRPLINPQAVVNVAISFDNPITAAQLQQALPTLNSRPSATFRSVFDPGGYDIGAGLTTTIATGGSHAATFYAAQKTVAQEEIADTQAALAGYYDGDPLDSDEISALQTELQGEQAYKSALDAGQGVIIGVNAPLSVAELRLLINNASSPLRDVRVLPQSAPLSGNLGDAISNRSVVRRANTGGSGGGASAASNGLTCAERGENTDNKSPLNFAPTRFGAQIKLHGSADGSGNRLKLARTRSFWRNLSRGLSWYCGDDPHDRGFEPETKAQSKDPQTGEAGSRWSTDNTENWWSNLPDAYQDNLSDGAGTAEYPDFAIGTGHGRALRYNTMYKTRNVLNRGQSNTGVAVLRAQATGRAGDIFEASFCRKSLDDDASCFFKKRTCTIAEQVLQLPKIRWYNRTWENINSDTCF